MKHTSALLLGARASLATALLTASACTPNELGNLEATAFGDLTAGEVPQAYFDAELDGACGAGAVSSHGADRIDRAPYVQRVTDREAVVIWTELDPVDTELVLERPDTGERRTITPSVEALSLPTGRQQEATLRDLEPATIYCYQLVDRDSELVSPTGFRTAPAPGAAGTVRFVALGDVGKATPDQFAVADQMVRVPHDFTLLTGDVGYDSGNLESFERHFFDVYADQAAQLPFFAASGNHDYKTAVAGPFRDVFALPENGRPAMVSELTYSFDWGNVHVVTLDTERVGPEQAAWLEADLATNRLPWTVVIGHRPPFSSGYHGGNAGVRQYFVPLFERYGVQLTLWGHDHDYERTKPINGVTYVVTGGGGTGTRPVGTSEFTAFSLAVTHFVYVEADEHQLTLWAVDATGQTFDSAQLHR
jgi:hypothetical protein